MWIVIRTFRDHHVRFNGGFNSVSSFNDESSEFNVFKWGTVLPQWHRTGEFVMAVQQNKKSPSKRGMHRSHDGLSNPPLALEPSTGEVHLRHHVSPTGYYRGKKVIKTKAD